MKKFAFIIPPTVELLDLAGPVQVFTEAKFYGFEADLEFYTYQDIPVSTAGLVFHKVSNYKEANLKEGDYVFVPGMDNNYVNSIPFKAEREFFNWLKECSERKIMVGSICTGAFALGSCGSFKRH
jgi:transcriptional regulator GlxA family with amidase domain